MKFTYATGAKPLDGYTIKRGIGQGGFGEVYYALSDGGKEVALKLVRGNLEVEMRGMAQCLNLKHPNLVALYDIKKDSQGDQWVVMEYVAGENLSNVLIRHPRGLPMDLTRQWFTALTKAVGYLHDNGIVHRDLKPANIFIENGMVKVGDYGLSKLLSGSARSAQTQSVGTVHYMAPEISTGNYGKQIDVYAAGVILYEMITGHVPFDGESAGEILMKHLTATPDLSKLPAGYAEVVGRALAKNPAHRYASLVEMARAVEQIGAPPQPVVVNRVAQYEKLREAPPSVLPVQISGRAKLAEWTGALVSSAVLAVLATLLWGVLDRGREFAEFGAAAYLTLLGSWMVLTMGKFWEQKRGNSWARRLVLLVGGVGMGLAAAWLGGWSLQSIWPQGTSLASVSSETILSNRIFGYLGFYAIAFALLRWWRLTYRTRSKRFALFPVFCAGIVGLMLMPMWPDQNAITGPLVLILTSIIVQIVSPWEPPAPKSVRRLKLRYA